MLSFNNACNYLCSKEGGFRTMIETRSIEEDKVLKCKAEVESMLMRYTKS